MKKKEVAVERLESDIRKEIFGYSDDEKSVAHKKLILKNNLRLTSPELLINKTPELDTYIDKLCELPHVKIVSLPTFTVYTLQDGYPVGTEQMVLMHAVASFTGFIEKVIKDNNANGVPKYYFIYNFKGEEGEMKIVRYSTFITPYPIIDGEKEAKA